MVSFVNRADAGKQLTEKLKKYKGQDNTIVIGLPRGGVIPALEVANTLGLPLDVIITRKIGHPYQPELAIGSITQQGTPILNRNHMSLLGITRAHIESVIETEQKELQRRLSLYRPGKAPLTLKDKTVIIVDDGIATGSTTRAAIQSARKMDARKIIIATPVSPPDVARRLACEVDEFICLATPSHFGSVGQFYQEFAQTKDDQVIEIMKQFS